MVEEKSIGISVWEEASEEEKLYLFKEKNEGMDTTW